MRGLEALGGWEEKGRVVPGNTFREMCRFISAGRTDSGTKPHSWPVIHMWSLSNWPASCWSSATAEWLETNGAILWWLFTTGLRWWGKMHPNKCTNVCLCVLQSLTNSKLTGLLLPLFKTYCLMGFIPISFWVLTSQTCSFRLQSCPSGTLQTIESLSYNHSFPFSLKHLFPVSVSAPPPPTKSN